MSFVRGCGVAAIAAGLLGCQAETFYQKAQPCEGSHCVENPAGGSTPSTGAGGVGGADGGAGVGDVLGTVHRITNPSFSDSGTSFAGAATILALPANSAMISAPYGGTSGTTFTLPGVPAGVTWFQVEDGTSGNSGILSTLSQLTLPSIASVALPVIDLGMMTTIANSLPTVAPKGVSLLGSHLVLLLTHLGVPYQGVSVTGVGSAQVAYDLGSGNYTDSGTKTGAAGTVILFNAGLQGSAVIFVTDATLMKQYSVPVQAAIGAVTLVTADL